VYQSPKDALRASAHPILVALTSW